MSRHKILVIDDDSMMLDLARFHLQRADYEVATAATAEEGLQIIAAEPVALALTDLYLPDLSGIELVKRLKELSPSTEIIMITGYSSVEAAIEATKAGAFFFIEKPLEFDRLLILLEKALEHRAQAAEIRRLQQQREAEAGPPEPDRTTASA
jgi:DNA-binding NtrC family response regulator